jgi:hypothetical protein
MAVHNLMSRAAESDDGVKSLMNERYANDASRQNRWYSWCDMLPA